MNIITLCWIIYIENAMLSFYFVKTPICDFQFELLRMLFIWIEQQYSGKKEIGGK